MSDTENNGKRFSFFDQLSEDQQSVKQMPDKIQEESSMFVGSNIQSEQAYKYVLSNDLSGNNQSKSQIRKRKIRLFISSIVFVFAYSLIIIITPANDKVQKSKRVQSFMNATADEKEELYEYLDNDALTDNEAAYEQFCNEMLGIDNNTALAGISISVSANPNYMNALMDNKAWLDGENLIIDIGGKVSEVSNSADEPILSIDNLYYIDKSSGNRLTQYRLSDGTKDILYNSGIKQYAVYGKYIIALGEDWNIYRINIESKECKVLVGNIQHFYAGSKIIAQNGDKIITVSLDGNQCEDLIDGAMLEGYNNRIVYFINVSNMTQIDGESEISRSIKQEITEKYNKELTIANGNIAVYSYNMDTKEIELQAECKDMVRAVYVVGDEIVIDTL